MPTPNLAKSYQLKICFKAYEGLQLASCLRQHEQIEYCRSFEQGYNTGVSLASKAYRVGGML